MKVNFHAGDLVLHVPTNETYEFGYYIAATGEAILYSKEGTTSCSLMQLRWLQRATNCKNCGSNLRNREGRIFHLNVECTR